MTYTPIEIASMMNVKFKQHSHNKLSTLIIDSRLVFNPSESLFFAIKGNRHDGHLFIDELYNKGVRNFVVSDDYQISDNHDDANFYKVENVLYALQKLTSEHRRKFNVPVLAITGSNGKTIVKEWLSQVIGDKENLTRSPRSYNSQVGVPLSVWQMNEQTTMAVFEAGISQTKEMKRLADIIQPTYGIFTNIGSAHQENFCSKYSKIIEKLRLFKDAKEIFYCKDQKTVDTIIKKFFSDKKLINWGYNENADLRITNIEHSDNTIITTIWKGLEYKWLLPFEDTASIENALHALLFLLYRGYDADYLNKKLKLLQPVSMRMEQKEGIGGSLIINDTYSSDFTSLELALAFLDRQALKKGMKKTLILSDMFQSGMRDEYLYKKVADLLRKRNVYRIIGVGEYLTYYEKYFFKINTHFFKSTDDFLSELHKFSFANEAVLIKGARNFEFERIVSQLETKQHNTVLEINLNALVNNLNVFRSRLNPETKVLAMVKAFGYGSGSYEIGGSLQHHKVDYLGVAFADEGMDLRKAGISLPILVMNPEESGFALMLKYNLEPEIYGFYILQLFNKAIEQEALSDIIIHLKIDTGMNRLGFRDEEIDKLINDLKKMPRLKVKSVFSHLAGSDSPEHDDFTRLQITRFENACKRLEEELGYRFLRHILNSAGIERFPEAHFDMVRLGIGLYGISANNDTRIENTISLKTSISQIKVVQPCESVGYGRSQRMENGGTIAVIPVGYADGLSRRLSCGKGKVMIHGQLAPTVGNICMDMCMIDISNLANVKEGDEVIIFGDDYPVSEIAKQSDTIPYEVLAGIGRRVKRVYFME